MLQSYVSHLRRRLQPGSAARTRSAVIVRESHGYAIRLPVDAVDAWRFEALLQAARGAGEPARVAALLTEALALWRGPALADYADEPWAEAEIGRLTELRAVAREQLLEARLELGEAALVVPELEAMVAEEPLREERWRLLALALYRAHRQADALGALRRARTTLADELGIDPGPGAAGSGGRGAGPVARRWTGPAAGRRRAPPVAGPTADRTCSTGTASWPRSVTALDDLVAGEPGLLLIEGPAGIGKTRLLAEARRLAARRGGAGARRPGQPAGAGVRLRGGPAAVRTRADRRRPPGRAARRGGGQRERCVRPVASHDEPSRTARSPSCTGCTGWRST